ncbi:MAG: hypothetical protein ABW168_27070 [Sedimenticola sp.]
MARYTAPIEPDSGLCTKLLGCYLTLPGKNSADTLMSSGNLILHPTNPTAAPPVDAVTQRLVETGFAGVRQQGEAHVYSTGERFLQLITFLGCSPFVQMEPKEEGDLDYCHIRLLSPSSSPGLIFGKNTRPPRCPHCDKGLSDWISHLTDTTPATPWHCPSCDKPLNLMELKWRQQGGCSRLFLVIPGIFPSEAVPLPELLNSLSGMGGEWSYFYAQEPQILVGGMVEPLFQPLT